MIQDRDKLWSSNRKFDLINICLLIDHRRFPLGNLRLGENIDQIFAFRNVQFIF